MFEFGCKPTVLFTGGGYHIYLPIDGIVLEDVEEFNKYSNPSRKYLKFAEQYLTDGKSDPNHNPSFSSCMVRVPGSINSKCGEIVKVVQEWDKTRPKIGLLGRFYSYLYGLQIEEEHQRLKYPKSPAAMSMSIGSIGWIESLINGLGVDDGRKLLINLVLVPYLCNIRHLPFEESYNIIKEWLTKCDKIRKFDRYIDNFIQDALKSMFRLINLCDLIPSNIETLRYTIV